MKYSRIMLAGPSGYGKSTLAEWISSEWSIPFLSGSVSDLIPQTREMLHQDMLARDSKELYMEDFQILNLRNKLFKDKEEFVSDRSYLDSASYFLYKQADKVPKCEVEHFFDMSSMLLAQQCDLLILLDFVPDLLNDWVTEDNNKRITSNYFQIEISGIMETSLKLMKYRTVNVMEYVTRGDLLDSLFGKHEILTYGAETGVIESIYGNTDVLIIREPNFRIRKEIIKSIIQ